MIHMVTPFLSVILLQAAPTSIDWQPLVIPFAGLITAIGVILAVFGAVIRSAVSQQKDTFDKTMVSNAALTAENATLKTDIIDLRKEDERLRINITTLQAARDAEKLLDAASALEQRTQATLSNQTIDDLRTRTGQMRDEITGLNQKIITLTAEQTRISGDYAAVVAERDQLKLENIALAEKVDRLEKQMHQLRADVDAISIPLAASNPQAAGELDRATATSKEETA